MTWRTFLRLAATRPGEIRFRAFRCAVEHGLTFRQVAEAADLSVSTVHQLVGAIDRSGPSLDDELPDGITSTSIPLREAA